jgi:hypothetical protein
MLVINTLRILSGGYFLLQLFAPPRYIPLHPAWLYRVLVITYLLLSIFRVQAVYKSRTSYVLLIAYALIPFLWTIYAFALQGELVRAVLSLSLSLLWIIAPLFLPVVILVEYRISLRNPLRLHQKSGFNDF